MDISHTLPEPRAFPAGLRESAGERLQEGLPQASLLDCLGVLFDLVLPNVAKGVIMRRPAVLALAERLDLDRRGIRRVQRLRSRYGEQPLVVRMPDRPRVLVIDPADVHRVLEQSPDRFATSSSAKRAALAHLEPRAALITSPGPQRRLRRELNEQVLQSGSPVHALGRRFENVVDEELGRLLARVRAGGGMGWDEFAPAWFTVVRRVVFGDAARDDHAISELVARLRSHANWAFAWPRRTDLIAELLARIRQSIARGDPDSLVGRIAAMRPPREAQPEHQVPQWLFAFDPAGMAIFRALALLATHPEAAAAAREEALGGDALFKPLLRASVLESLRLWPTTPLILRETTAETRWRGATLAAGSSVLIYAPFFHRDGQRLPFADRFEPHVWLAERTTRDWPLVPFSSGPAVCPGRHLVLLLASLALARLLSGPGFRLERPGWLSASRPLPATLSHAGLRFRAIQAEAHRPRSSAGAA